MLACPRFHALYVITVRIVLLLFSCSSLIQYAEVASARHATSQAHANRRDARGDDRRPYNQNRSRTQNFVSANDRAVQFQRGSPPTARFNMRLQERSAASDVITVMQIIAEMKEKGVPPDLMTYYYLTMALSSRLLHQETWAAFHDMVALGLRPDVQIFNNLIAVSNASVNIFLWLMVYRRCDIARLVNSTTSLRKWSCTALVLTQERMIS